MPKVDLMPADITIHPSTRDDIAAVDALLARSYPVLLKPDYPPSVLVTALPLISRAQPHLLTCGTYYVAVDGQGAVLGAGGWTFAAPGGAEAVAGTANIRHVVTDHRQTRRGIGRALMTHVLAEAASAGAQRLECLSTLTAVPFYRSVGFQALGPVDVPLQPGVSFPAVLMDRPL